MNDNKDEDIYKVDDDTEEYAINDEKEDLKAKLIKYGIIAFACLIILILLIAIFFPKGEKKEIISRDVTLTTGDKYALDYSRGTYSWTSSNQTVAKVSENGDIVALKDGDTTITIKVNGETITYKVHVDKVDDSVLVTNVKMEKNTIELEKDKTYNMTVIFTPSNVANIQLSWTSSNDKVATVKDGVITAVAPGICIITVKTPNGNMDNCLVKVTRNGSYNPIEEIKINSSEITINKGASYNVSYEVVPSESASLINWESSNEDVITVENGIIYAVNTGEAQVTAKSGDIIKTISVKVNDDNGETKGLLNTNKLGLLVGDSYNLAANNNLDLTWTSSNPDVAAIDENGTITAKFVGEVVITVESLEGQTDECIVTITNGEVDDTIVIDPSSLSMNIGEQATLTAIVTPSNNPSGIVWKSSNSSVATVTNGEVKALANGTATITATLPNGMESQCVVTVSTKVINPAIVKINISSLTLDVNKSSQLSVTILPANATNKSVTWSSSDPKVATVDKNGKVTGKKKGNARIYAKASNGIYDVCTVIVK